MYFQSFLDLSLSITPQDFSSPVITHSVSFLLQEDSSQEGVKGKKVRKWECNHSEKTIVVVLSPCKVLVLDVCPGQNRRTALILLSLFCFSASWKPGTVALTQTIVCYSMSLPNTNLTTCSMANIMSPSKYIHWNVSGNIRSNLYKTCTCIFIAFHSNCGRKCKELAWSRTLAKTIAGCTGNRMILMFVVYILSVWFSWKVCADATGGTSADQISYSVFYSLPICFSLSTDWQRKAVTMWNFIVHEDGRLQSVSCTWSQAPSVSIQHPLPLTSYFHSHCYSDLSLLHIFLGAAFKKQGLILAFTH